MFKKTLLAILFITATSQSIELQAQNSDLYNSLQPVAFDSLTVERESGHKITLVWPYKRNIHKNDQWEKLLDDFISDFKKVADNVPSYDFFHINYVQGKTLVVNEVTGRETYTVNEQKGMDYVKSNLSELSGGKYRMKIEFNDVSELFDPKLKSEITEAVAQVKHRFYISTFSPERHYYSVDKAEMQPFAKPELKFFIPFGARLGVVQDDPYIDLRIGAGLIIDKNYYASLNWNTMTRYQRQLLKTTYDSYVGFAIGSMGAGFGSEFGFLVKSSDDNEDADLVIRSGVNYRTSTGVLLGVDYYIRDRNSDNIGDNVVFGFHVGFGF